MTRLMSVRLPSSGVGERHDVPNLGLRGSVRELLAYETVAHLEGVGHRGRGDDERLCHERPDTERKENRNGDEDDDLGNVSQNPTSFASCHLAHAPVKKLAGIGALIDRKLGRIKEIGPEASRSLDGVSPAPGVNLGMVAREQNLGDSSALVVCGPRVLGVLEKPEENDSSTELISSPSAPGSSLTTASVTTIAGSSPPVRT